MENFSELIKKRRSMRKFTGEELSQEEVVALLKAIVGSLSRSMIKSCLANSRTVKSRLLLSLPMLRWQLWLLPILWQAMFGLKMLPLLPS